MEPRAQPFPGLFDDPLFQSVDLQKGSELHIAPLRDPLPSRTSGALSPLEPKAEHDLGSKSSKVKLHRQQTPSSTRKRTPSVTPATVILARDARKPITAISELLESATTQTNENTVVQLPSFVSLSAVEKTSLSPSATSQDLRATKRQRLDPDTATSDDYIHLPRPQQQHQGPRAPPLLPTIVNGIHEPPPNAALLPPMETNTQARVIHTQKTDTVRSTATARTAGARPPEKMLNSPAMEGTDIAHVPDHGSDVQAVEEQVVELSLTRATDEQQKTRKTPCKWTDNETQDLLQGVEKHGTGKWKSILDDAAFSFEHRTAVDLKDRYRVISGLNNVRGVNVAHRAAEPLTPSSPSSVNAVTRANPAKQEQHSAPKPPLPPDKPSSSTNKPPLGRRIRRAWTSSEDANLLAGVAKHGFQWTAIHDDAALDLSHRKATDLRDRIRNKFPEGYRNAETAPPKSQTPKTNPKKGPETNNTNNNNKNTVNPAKASQKVPKDRAAGRKTASSNKELNSGGAKSSTLTEGTADGFQEQPAGRTLPPLDIDDDDWDWSNNTLPPLLDWEEMGILSYQSGQ